MRWTRRSFVASLGASSMAGQVSRGRSGSQTPRYPPNWFRYADPATEFEVFRLTDPASSSYLPAHYNRALARRGGFVLYTSDSGGSPQVYRMDLKTGATRQMTSGKEVDASSVALLVDDQSFCYFDGPVLRQVALAASGRERELYTVPEGATRNPGFSVTIDGVSGVLGETKNGTSRLVLIGIARKTATPVIESAFPMTHPIARPKRAQILYRQGDEALWLVNFDGRQNRKLRTATGKIGPARWSPDGKTILYLNFPEEAGKLNTIRELTPDENTDKLLAPTSQFMHFGCNGDSSAFVGASRNVASPHLLLLLRVTRRELTICEHKAKNAATVAPVFSPDSQRVYFQSDRDGKPAIYRMEVERFVEKTDEET